MCVCGAELGVPRTLPRLIPSVTPLCWLLWLLSLLCSQGQLCLLQPVPGPCRALIQAGFLRPPHPRQGWAAQTLGLGVTARPAHLHVELNTGPVPQTPGPSASPPCSAPSVPQHPREHFLLLSPDLAGRWVGSFIFSLAQWPRGPPPREIAVHPAGTPSLPRMQQPPPSTVVPRRPFLFLLHPTKGGPPVGEKHWRVGFSGHDLFIALFSAARPALAPCCSLLKAYERASWSGRTAEMIHPQTRPRKAPRGSFLSHAEHPASRNGSPWG